MFCFSALLSGVRSARGFCRIVPAALVTVVFSAQAQLTAKPAAPLTVFEAMRLAERNAPGLDARKSAVEMSEAMAESARALPDPKLKLGVDNLPVNTADKFSVTRDFMTMRRVGIARDMPREEKRELKAARYRLEAKREGAMQEDTRLMVRRDAALAWVERHYAGAATALIDDLKSEARLQYDVLLGQVRAGRATPVDALAAQTQLRSLDDRRAEFTRLAARARAQLERWLGRDAAAMPAAGWSLADARIERHALLAEHHPHLGAFAQAEAQAGNDIAQAQAQEKGDWGWEVAYQKRGSQFSDMVSFGIAIDLPSFSGARIGAEVRAKMAQKQAAERNSEEAQRQHELEVKLALADWDAANARRTNFDDALLPLAKDRIDQTIADYKSGAGKLADVLDARRQWLETRLSQLQLEQDASRAWAQLQYFNHTAHGAADK